MPCHDARDSSRRPRNVGRVTSSLAISVQVRAKFQMDQSSSRKTMVQEASGSRSVLQRLLFLHYIMCPKVKAQSCWVLSDLGGGQDIENGSIENVPAPATTIDYWRLPKDATLQDMLTVIRADKAHHRPSGCQPFCFCEYLFHQSLSDNQ